MEIKTRTVCLPVFMLFFLFSLLSCGPTLSVQPSASRIIGTQIPDSLKIDSVEIFEINNSTIDLYTTHNSSKTLTYEFWYSDNKLVHSVQYPKFEINHKWLIDLDGDRDVEVVRAQGYEDGVNYRIFKKQKSSEEILLNFNPVLLDARYPNKQFKGFPWDIEGVVMDSAGQILSSFQEYPKRDDNYSVLVKQKQLPFVFFYGNTTQPEFDIRIDSTKIEYLWLEELIVNSRDQVYQEYRLPDDSYFLDSISLQTSADVYKIFSIEKLSEKNNVSGSHFGLPIVVLKDNLLIEENFDLVFDYDDNCPSDGYDGIYVEGRKFTIQQTFCADFLFVKSKTTFKLDHEHNEIILDNYIEEYTDRSNPDRLISSKRWTSENFGKVLFSATSRSFLLELRQTTPD